jgi:hypothetical protein
LDCSLGWFFKWLAGLILSSLSASNDIAKTTTKAVLVATSPRH